MKKNLLALAVSLLAPFASIYAVEVQNLRCEFRTSPLAIDTAKPGLSWKLETGNLKLERGINQTAYQILVASTPEILAKPAARGGGRDTVSRRNPRQPLPPLIQKRDRTHQQGQGTGKRSGVDLRNGIHRKTRHE